MALISQALTTRARYKTFSSIRSSDDKYDNVIDPLINSSSKMIVNYCGRDFVRQTNTNEEYDGTGSNELLLRRFPVQSFTRLQRRDSTDNEDDWTTIDTQDYHRYDDIGKIRLVVGRFVEIPRHYRATYVSGFYLPQDDNFTDGASDSLPNDVELACQLTVSKLLHNLRRSGSNISQVSVQDSSVSFFRAQLLDDVIKGLLDGHKRLDTLVA